MKKKIFGEGIEIRTFSMDTDKIIQISTCVFNGEMFIAGLSQSGAIYSLEPYSQHAPLEWVKLGKSPDIVVEKDVKNVMEK